MVVSLSHINKLKTETMKENVFIKMSNGNLVPFRISYKIFGGCFRDCHDFIDSNELENIKALNACSFSLDNSINPESIKCIELTLSHIFKSVKQLRYKDNEGKSINIPSRIIELISPSGAPAKMYFNIYTIQ